MTEDYYKLLSADSLINILTSIRREHPEMSYKKLSALIGLPANRGANLSYFINGRTSDPTLKSLKRYTDMAHQFQEFYTDTIELNEYINILKPGKWRQYWLDLHGTPVDFDEFEETCNLIPEFIKNRIALKATWHATMLEAD